MPFVQRDFAGKIIGVYPNPQPQPDGRCLTDLEPLPDDHPDVVEYMKGFQPEIDKALRMTEEDWKRVRAESERLQKEIDQLQNLFLRHMNAWAELETSLSALLYASIHRPSSNIAYAIYYGLAGFDARQRVVNNTIIQLIDENDDLKPIRDSWTKINKKVGAAKMRRNDIAHGIIQKLSYGPKPTTRAVMSPLPFDVIRINRKIKANEHPGMTVNELTAAVKILGKLSSCIDGVNDVISNFHRFGAATLPKTLPPLATRLTDLSSR